MAPGETYSQAFLPPGSTSLLVGPGSRSYAAFVQDTWRLAPTLTVDAGVRYDVQTWRAHSSPVTDVMFSGTDLTTSMPAADTNNWGPRASVAWTPSPRTLARVAYGIGYAATPSSFAAAVQRYGSGDVRLITLSGADGDLVPTYQAPLSTPPPTLGNGRPIVVAFGRDFEQARIQHVTAAFDWEWMPRSSIGLSYVHATGRNLPQATERNLGTPLAVTFEDAATGQVFPSVRYAPGGAFQPKNVSCVLPASGMK